MMSDAREIGGPAVGGPFIKPRYLKRKVLQLANGPTKNFYDLARSLSTLHELSPAVLKTIEDRSKLTRRTLYYLVDVGRILRRYQIDKEQAERIGWTKLQILARHLGRKGDVPAEKLASLLKVAAEKKARDLPLALAGKARTTAERTVLLHLSADDHKLFVEAMVKHGAIRKGRGLINQDKALMRLVRAALERTT
jgi:hypothetical protein